MSAELQKVLLNNKERKKRVIKSKSEEMISLGVLSEDKVQGAWPNMSLFPRKVCR